MPTPIVMRADGSISAMKPSDLKEVAERDERIRALERINATLAAEVDRMRPVVERVNDWLLSKGAPARAVALSEAYNAYKASEPK